MVNDGSPEIAQDPEPSAWAVAAFLADHPNFFVSHADLLETLELPHPSGPAVSLVARQLELLRSKNRLLAEQMDQLLKIARENDGLSQRLHQLTLTLMDARSLEDVLASLDWGLHQLFEADFVGVRLLKPERPYPVQQLFVPENHPSWAFAMAEISKDRVRCGRPTPEEARFLFGSEGDRVGSFVLMRLHHAALRGLLAIGCQDPDRYQADMGSVFLRQLSEVLAARLAPLLEITDFSHGG